MVARVEGIVNGDPVIFNRVVGDQWESKVPASLNGTYVVEMTAWDEAGNMAHKSMYLLQYDPINLKSKLIPFPYSSRFEKEISYCSNILVSDYFAVLENETSCGR